MTLHFKRMQQEFLNVSQEEILYSGVKLDTIFSQQPK